MSESTTRDPEQLRLAERKREEENLRRMATVVRDSNDAITIQDFEGRITAWNHGAELMYGYSEAEALLMNIERLTAPEKVAEQKDFIRRLVAGEDITSFETQRVTKDGRVIDVWMTVTKLMDDAGKPIGLASTERDITALKREERARQNLEEQLRASQKMEAIGSLAGGVAHDFNNLLSVILSYTSFAMESLREGDPLLADLLEVKNAGERAAVLTRQLLAFSRKQVLQPSVLDINGVTAGLEKMLRRILGEDVELVQELAPELGLVMADQGQIEQVLMNLVVNARDAMPMGGKLTIGTANIELDEEYSERHLAVKPGSYVQLAVSDTGHGMDEQTQKRIFEPFFTTKEKDKGTGLGLAMVYGIVKQSGGDIWVYSELGQGTTFKVYLPRDRSTGARSATVSPVVAGRATGTETVLIVEDEESLRKVIRRVLVAAGYTVMTAKDGDEALQICARHTEELHLVLTDVVMPRMSGRVLVQELAKTRPTVKVVYMSGYTDAAISHHGILDAGTHFLAKPFTSTGLLQKVREVLDIGIIRVAGEREPAAEDDAEKREQPLDKAAHRPLSPDVLARLRKAVISARYNDIVKIVETIRVKEPDLATDLRRMLDLFDYDGMRELLSQ
ncbi:MAG: hybrid sensor histidine kinase/response regulator [Deltaproteobacteria bacterium HGW-Deltaproteobacteria-22]|nr:MAG: hybrid sensor histidine kinase/response regulator [Deltaproteobacteria bacterium HGW-Deltaproteobacteria-22]